MKYALHSISRRVIATTLALALTLGVIGFAAPSAYASPDGPMPKPGNEKSCHVTLPDGSVTWLEHGTVVITTRGKYRCNDGTWEKVNEYPAGTTDGFTYDAGDKVILGETTTSSRSPALMSITQGVKEKVHSPIYDRLSSSNRAVGSSTAALPYIEQDNVYKSIRR